ncbi:unnamed protein product, partial [Ixodes hexagonus]
TQERRSLSPREYEQGVPSSPGPAPSPPRASPTRRPSQTLSPVVSGDRCGGGRNPRGRLALRKRRCRGVAASRPFAVTAAKVSSHRFLWRQRHERQGKDRGGR